MIDRVKEAIDRNWLGDSEDDVYKENILDHYKNPRNFGRLEKADMQHREHNPLCGDVVEIFAEIKNGKIIEIKFRGNGCAVSMASASMLTDKVKEMKVEDAKKLTKEDIFEMLGVKLGAVRMKCGLLSLKALTNGLNRMDKRK